MKMNTIFIEKTDETQYVKMSEAFRKIYLHYQALYKDAPMPSLSKIGPANKTEYVKMSEAFRKIYLHHQALYKEPDDVNIFYEKLHSF